MKTTDYQHNEFYGNLTCKNMRKIIFFSPFTGAFRIFDAISSIILKWAMN